MTDSNTTTNETTASARRWQGDGRESGKIGKKRRMFRTVRFQAWTYFFLLAALTLFGLWLFQLLFYKSAYRTMKRQEVERLGARIAQKYPGHAGEEWYADYLRQTAFDNGVNVIIFQAHDTYEECPSDCVKFAAQYLSSQFNLDELPDKGLIAIDDARIVFDWDTFYGKIKKSERVSYLSKSKKGSYFVYGKQLSGAETYLYMTAPYVPAESTVTVMTEQLLIATAVCLALSLVVAWFVSSRITKPVTEFSRVAKQLGAGDYSVRFKGNGYYEIDNLADTLNYATEEIGKTEQMRRDFLANVGHDLRTPLTMVKAYAEMIRDISGSDEIKRTRHSQVIVDEADRLSGLVNDILNLSKLQSGTEQMHFVSVDMRTLTRTVIERFDVYATREGYTFEFAHEGDCTAYGDEKRLEQVLYNLVGNAVSHAGDDKRVCITVSDRGEDVRVSVRDFGDGIAPEELDKVWERYYRANQHKRNVVGSGLGLSIVKSILQTHNALFGVSSTLGEGTEFWFELHKSEAAPQPQIPHKRGQKSKRNEKDEIAARDKDDKNGKDDKK